MYDLHSVITDHHVHDRNKELVKLIQWVKIAHLILQYVSNLSHFIILSLPM